MQRRPKAWEVLLVSALICPVGCESREQTGRADSVETSSAVGTAPAAVSPRDRRPPTITVIEPAAGTTILREDGRITLRMMVRDAEGAIAEVRAGGEVLGAEVRSSVAPAEVNATLRVPVPVGPVTLPVEAIDGSGNVASTVLSVLVADRWHDPAEILPRQVVLELAPSTLAPRSAGRLLDEALADLRLREHLPTNLGSALGHRFGFENVAHGAPHIRIEPARGRLLATVRIPDFSADLLIRGPLTLRRPISARFILVDLRVEAAVAGGHVSLVPRLAGIRLQGLDMGLPSELEDLGEIIRSTVEQHASRRLLALARRRLPRMARRVEERLRGGVASEVGLPLPGAHPVPVALELRLRTARVDRGGLRAEVLAAVRGPEPSLPLSVEDACPSAPERPVARRGAIGVRIPLEVVNALGHALHAGGGWDLRIPAEDIEGAARPVEVRVGLPPTVSACGAPDGELLARFGGLSVQTAVAVGGVELPVQAELGFEVAVALSVSEDGRLRAAPHLVAGSVVSSSALLASAAGALAGELVPLILPEDGPLGALGLELRLRSVQVDAAGSALVLGLDAD